MARKAPNECPVCGSELRFHKPETVDDFEYWEYGCHAIVHREDDGKLHAIASCESALHEALDELNAAEPTQQTV